MDEYRGVAYLKQKLDMKKPRVRLRYNYYEMKERTHNRGLLTPPWLKGMYEATVGWCTQSVDALSDRLIFKGFKENSDYYGANEIFAQNNPSILYSAAIKESLIGSCAFVHITHGLGEERTPRLSVLTASDATGIMDEQTGLLKEGYAVLDWDRDGKPILEAYYTKEGTQYYLYGKETEFEKNPGSYPLLVPIVYKADSRRPFGHSRITRSSMYLQQFAQNTMERAEITAEFYSFPQKYVSGTDPDIEPLESWKASLSAFLRFDKDEAGDHPVIGQFQQQSMTPYIEQIRMAASMFAPMQEQSIPQPQPTVSPGPSRFAPKPAAAPTAPAPSQQIKCPHCGEIAGGGKFCGNCGQPLPQKCVCSSCGIDMPAGSKFCPNCGTKVN